MTHGNSMHGRTCRHC